MSWNDEKVAKLKELWGTHTAAEISKIIGGVTRNAIIGKANRLNLSSKIKTRSASSNQNFQNSNNEKNDTKQKRGRKSRRGGNDIDDLLNDDIGSNRRKKRG